MVMNMICGNFYPESSDSMNSNLSDNENFSIDKRVDHTLSFKINSLENQIKPLCFFPFEIIQLRDHVMLCDENFNFM